MPSKKKKYNSRFPPARIKKIMQSDDEVGKVAAVVPIIICEFSLSLSLSLSLFQSTSNHPLSPSTARVLEIFVESLLTESCKITKQKNARTLTPAHL
jgi:hypothetical protein